MKLLMFISILLGFSKTMKELTYKNKIGNEYWEYIKKDKDEKLEKFFNNPVNKNINLNALRNEEGETSFGFREF